VKGFCTGHYQQLRKGKPFTPVQARQARNGARGCAFPGCAREHASKGYCDGHYQQIRAGKELAPLQIGHDTCTFPGCTQPHDAKGLCATHYAQQRAGKELRRSTALPSPVEELCEGVWRVTLYGADENGRPGASLEAELCVLSPEDVPRVQAYRWREADGYAVTKINRKRVLMHRMILDVGPDVEVDHINGNRLDNRRSNLRIVIHAENAQNRGVRSDSLTGHRNINYDPKKKLYRVIVTLNGKRVGHRHARLEDAIAEAEQLREQLFTHSTELRVRRITD
jgi:hypothetical protein